MMYLPADLNLLHTLDAFVRGEGIAGAATLLGRSPAAISARLRALEDDLGVVLFEKVGRRLRLTPTGRIVHTQAKPVIEAAREIVAQARASISTVSGCLRVGALPTVGVYAVSELSSALVTKYPGLEIDLVYGLAVDLVEQLRRGRLDAVVTVGDIPSDPRLKVQKLRGVRPVLVSSTGVELQVTPAALATMKLLAWTGRQDPFFDRIWRFLEDQKLAEHVRLRVAHIETIKRLVQRGMGVAILPDYTVAESELYRCKVEGLTFVHTMWIATRIAPASPALIAFSNALTQSNPGEIASDF